MATLQQIIADILAGIETLENDPALLNALQRRSLVERGLGLVDGPDFPLCDQPWEDEENLRAHLKEKLVKSEEAGKVQQGLLSSAVEISRQAVRLIGSLGQTLQIANSESDAACAQLISTWATMRRKEAAKLASEAAKAAYDAYCRAMEDELDALYNDVQGDFSTLYRLINEGDKASSRRN
jgi:hypothetical protein